MTKRDSTDNHNKSAAMEYYTAANNIWRTIVPPPMTDGEAIAVAQLLFQAYGIPRQVFTRSAGHSQGGRSGFFYTTAKDGWVGLLYSIAGHIADYAEVKLPFKVSEGFASIFTKWYVYWLLTMKVLEEGWLDGRFQ